MGKYTFTGETKEISCDGRTVTLHRIRALADFGDVRAGDTGGWLESEGNLSKEGGAWVYGEAKVYGEAEICGKAEVYGRAIVCGEAEVRGEAKVHGEAKVYGEAEVYGEAVVCGEAKVCREAGIFLGNHVVTVGRIGSRSDVTTFYHGKNGRVMVKCGCFNDTSDRFVERVEETHGGTKYALVYKAAVALARAQIGLS